MQKFKVISALGLGLLFACATQAQMQFDDVDITDTPLRGSVHMLQGMGGNIGVSAGKDGILIIDDQFEPLAEKISAALDELGSGGPRYIINTHYHGDHTGGNAHFHTHKGSTIFAHENVRIRLASDDSVDEAALPVVTYEDGIKLHFNGETLHVMHLPSAHTDGDSVVWFEQSNILHTGDLLFNGLFPFIDLSAGGSVSGYIESVKSLLEKVDENTMIISGHGPIANKKQYESNLAMIEETYAYVQAQKAAGKSLDAVIQEGLDEKWKDWSWSFISEEKWISTLYQ
ncbi:MBL fold metallo-hydrolase [Alteromonas aestuariivivens]|uniref:MBL fold metallo-hydrolase n=1 Tax=Alteromonas aestuariivivens TaxID=1938339 RepID=UPI003CCC727F